MSFEEFRISKRGEEGKYPDWQEWLKGRGISVDESTPADLGQYQRERNIAQSKAKLESKERFKLLRGGKNFDFICWGNFVELKLWER